MKNYYEILKIPRNATKSEIINAYKKIALEVHPDKNPIEEKKIWTEKFQELSLAYSTLCDQELRKKYDEQFLKSFYKNDKTTKNTKFDIIVFTNKTTSQLHDLIFEISNIFKNIHENINSKSNLEELKNFFQIINQKREKFNSLFKRLDWVIINCSNKCQQEAYYLKELVTKIKLKAKITDAYSFLCLQEIKVNCIEDNKFLETLINRNHNFLIIEKTKFNLIYESFLVTIKRYESLKTSINDFQNFKFFNLIAKIDSLFKSKTDLIDNINKMLLLEEKLLREEELRQESAAENDNDVSNIEISNQSSTQALSNERQINDYLQEYELRLAEKAKVIAGQISVLSTNNMIIENEIANNKKQKINPLLNCLLSFFSFNCYNKNKKIDEDNNLKIKNNLLLISNLKDELKMDKYIFNLEKVKLITINFQNQSSSSNDNNTTTPHTSPKL